MVYILPSLKRYVRLTFTEDDQLNFSGPTVIAKGSTITARIVKSIKTGQPFSLNVEGNEWILHAGMLDTWFDPWLKRSSMFYVFKSTVQQLTSVDQVDSIWIGCIIDQMTAVLTQVDGIIVPASTTNVIPFATSIKLFDGRLLEIVGGEDRQAFDTISEAALSKRVLETQTTFSLAGLAQGHMSSTRLYLPLILERLYPLYSSPNWQDRDIPLGHAGIVINQTGSEGKIYIHFAAGQLDSPDSLEGTFCLDKGDSIQVVGAAESAIRALLP